jgi:hypothetical protein
MTTPDGSAGPRQDSPVPGTGRLQRNVSDTEAATTPGLLWSREHVGTLPELDAAARDDLAPVLARVLAGYDAFFGFRTSYLLGIHSAPVNAPDDERALGHLHVEVPA